jgi:hypothetical protein
VDAVDVPVSAIVAPLPDVPTLPVIVHVGCRIVSIPPVPEAEMEAPIGLDTVTPVSWIVDERSKVVDAIVNVTFATVPSLITFAFNP